jgi:mRNA interferase HicA
MKKTELEKRLRKLGWFLKRNGGNHDIWTNGEIVEPIPRHDEIVDVLAKKILRKVEQNPGKENEF